MTPTDLHSPPGVAPGDVGTGDGVASTTPSRITPCAACLQETKEESVQLRQLMHDVDAAIDDRLFWHRPSGFARLLSELRDQVAMHFTLEEAFDRFSDAIHDSPELSSLAESLRAEHRALYTEARRIAEQAEWVTRRPRGHRIRHLVCRTLAFRDQLQRHEHRENDFVQRAQGDDVGVGG